MIKEIDRYFFKYKNLCKKIFIKELELEALNESIAEVGSRGFSEMTNSSHNNNGLECKLIQQENLKELIAKLYSKKEKQRAKHVNDFKKLSKDEYEIILTCYYLDRTNIKNISIKLDKSIGHVKKMKREALKELVQIIKK